MSRPATGESEPEVHLSKPTPAQQKQIDEARKRTQADAARRRTGPPKPAPKPVVKKPTKAPAKAPTQTPAATTGTGNPTTDNSSDLPYLDKAEMAQNYGFALSFIQSDKEIAGIFDQAVKQGYTTAKFIAAIRNSAYYKKHAESWRQTEILRLSDPQSYNNKIAAVTAELSDRAAQLGAPISWTQLQSLASNAVHFGWNDAQINDQLGGYVRAVNGVYNGAVGDSVDTLKQTAWKNGVALADTTVQSMASQIAKGGANVGFFQRYIRNMAKTAAPGYADQLESGMDLYDVASPYIQSMAKTLELNPADIDLFNPTIRGALTATGADGKPSSKSLWQFENELRKDPRWLSTQNARDAGMTVAHRVLQDFGFSF
jgi:hypothetical protein